MKLYNTMTRSKEELIPREPGKIAMYVCGPTVYNHIHIGNARTFLSFDTIRRYLEWRGFEVAFVQNITDVDDKIINKANEEGRAFSEVAEEYTKAFVDVMDAIGVEPPTIQPKATETIPEMIELIEHLIEKDHAYAVGGDVYFAVRSFPAYGKLSGRDVNDMRSGARVACDSRKSDPLDFALWKSAKPDEPSWDSPWGKGRPGWHIECSVMSEDELGLPFDIHGGGADLIFPHHENEIAQSEAASGVEFARYWLHGGMMLIDAEKMSKSLGNFVLLKDVIDDYDAPVLRLLMMQTHYRSPLDFSYERLDEAKSALDRLETFIRNMHWLAQSDADETAALGTTTSPAVDTVGDISIAVTQAREKFITEMDDDFNTAGAIGSLFELTKKVNTLAQERESNLTSDDRAALTFAADTIADLLGAIGVRVAADTKDTATVYPAEVAELATSLGLFKGTDTSKAMDALLEARKTARLEKDWPTADAIRNGLSALSITVEDTPLGARVIYGD